ncbi:MULTISPECIES: WXG100 family type VII secretion target [Micromonospora]|uniref:WXG100 family type VII secretion target n=1 Tax=Micromonospora craniellae TaxID=2294034 RepID=A0A372FWQ3_9ACTN|nr:WXG100 family type VII secretion target [Micromonospora craniellae]QOC93880.1 WXG100 family type VII secretion target [Micromonospora craniellae]RFS44940.1 WXG100 family type VII secretion target [Micromonospora craniellae]
MKLVDITPQMLLDGSQSCTDTAAQLQARLATLRRDVDDLASYWLGPGSKAYKQTMEEYDSCGRMLNDALNGISRGLQRNAGNYVTADEATVRTMPEINGIPAARLGPEPGA